MTVSVSHTAATARMTVSACTGRVRVGVTSWTTGAVLGRRLGGAAVGIARAPRALAVANGRGVASAAVTVIGSESVRGRKRKRRRLPRRRWRCTRAVRRGRWSRIDGTKGALRFVRCCFPVFSLRITGASSGLDRHRKQVWLPTQWTKQELKSGLSQRLEHVKVSHCIAGRLGSFIK